MQQQRVGRLRVVVAFFVEVAELVEVPGTEQRVRHVTQTHSLTFGLQAEPVVAVSDQSLKRIMFLLRIGLDWWQQ